MTWKCTNTPKGEDKLYSDARGVVPSLDLRFAEGKNLNDYMTGQNLITFSRSSIGTYVDENGIIQTATADTPRFDHNPTTGESLGLLIEESRTNVQWFDSLSSVLSSASADGPTGNSANVYERAATNETAEITVQTIWTQNNGMVLSFFVKKQGNGRYFKVHPQGQLFGNVKWTYDYDTKTIVENNLFSFSVDELPNGWHRIKVVSSPVVRSTAHALGISVHSALPTSGTNLDTGLLYGIQLEEGSFPTSYIPTTSTALTRSADDASITGSNFSSWFNSPEGTIFSDVQTQNTSCFGWNLSDGSNNNRFVFDPGVNTGTAAAIVSGGGPTFGTPPTVLAGGGKIAFAYKPNDYGVYGNQTQLAGTSPAAVPTGLNQIGLGYRGNYAPDAYLNGTIARLTYFPDRLEDSVLQAITQ